jgi:hypothetical protein
MILHSVQKFLETALGVPLIRTISLCKLLLLFDPLPFSRTVAVAWRGDAAGWQRQWPLIEALRGQSRES